MYTVANRFSDPLYCAGPASKHTVESLLSILLLITFLVFVPPAYAKYGGGTGTAQDPFLIYTAEQMNTIGIEPNDWDKHFKLMADIDLSCYSGTEFNTIGFFQTGPATRYSAKIFSGVFDGNGKKIFNFTYNSKDRNYIGIFGHIYHHAIIKDVGLINAQIDAGSGDYIGALVGKSESVQIITGHGFLPPGAISNCYIENGTIRGHEYVGGLIGDGSRIFYCHAKCSVSGDSSVGGIVGYGFNILHSYAQCSVTGKSYIGGLVGYGEDLWACFADSQVAGEESVGGLAGSAITIRNCYSTSVVSGKNAVGGLVGNGGGWLQKCYSTGRVAPGTSGIGGLVGKGYAQSTACFWDTQTSGQTSSAYGMGKTTAQMQDPNTFMAAGWEFVGDPNVGPNYVWAENPIGGYPILWYQLSPLPALPNFAGGSGRPEDPYIIKSSAQMNSIGRNPRLMNANFRLVNDIDLTGVKFFMVGAYLFPFTGTFDGSGNKIANFIWNSKGQGCDDTKSFNSTAGLFCYVDGPSALIKDLGLTDANIIATNCSYAGALVGRSGNGSIIRCYVENSTIKSQYVGALIGDTYGTIVQRCCSANNIVQGNYAGGLIEWNSGIVTECYSSCNVYGDWATGGLVGWNSAMGLIINCYSSGQILGNNRYLGGLVGLNDAEITDGRLIGAGEIRNSYSTAVVTGNAYRIGGLVGSNGGIVANSFWDIDSSGFNNMCGSSWYYGCDNTRGKTTDEMRTAIMFIESGWDFVGETTNGSEDVWDICEGTNYPRLTWQIPRGDFICPDSVDFRDFGLVAFAWQSEPNEPNWNLSCDISQPQDSVINFKDLATFCENWLVGTE